METLQQVVFSGDLCPGFEAAQVRLAVKDKLHLSDAQLAGLFSGRRRVLKRGISVDVAQQWVTDFARLGAAVTIEPLPEGTTLRPSERTVPTAAVALRTALAEPGPEAAALLAQDEAARASRRAAFRARHGLTDASDEELDADAELLGSTFDSDFIPSQRQPVPTMFGTGWQGRMGRLRAAVASSWLLIALGAVWWQWLRDPGTLTLVLAGLTSSVVLFYGLRLMVLRLHDLNLSGWLALITLVPVLGPLVGLGVLLWPGTPTENNHGQLTPYEDWTPLVGVSAILLLVLGLLMSAAIEAYFSHNLPKLPI